MASRMKVKVSHSAVSNSLWPHELYSPWDSLGQNTEVGSLSLLQRIFPTQGSNPGLPHCRQIFYQVSHKGSPRILDRVACPFSSRSSWPRNRTSVSCIAGVFFNNWAIREAPPVIYVSANLFSPFLSLSSVLQKNLFNLIFLKFFKNYLQVIDSLLRDLSFIVWTMFPFDHFSSDTLITLVAFFTFKFLLF